MVVIKYLPLFNLIVIAIGSMGIVNVDFNSILFISYKSSIYVSFVDSSFII